MSDLKMPDTNVVVFAGRLTRDPELRYLGGGDAVCNFALANTKYFKGKDGGKAEKTVFVNCVAWRKQAEWIGEQIKKGRPVEVQGGLAEERWEDKNGAQRSKVVIQVQRLQLLDWDGAPQHGGGGGGGYQQPTGAPPASSGPPASAPPSAPPMSHPPSGGGGYPPPRPIEEPIPEDDIPF